MQWFQLQRDCDLSTARLHASNMSRTRVARVTTALLVHPVICYISINQFNNNLAAREPDSK